MNIPMIARRRQTTRQLTALGTLTTGALIATAIMYVYFQAVILQQIEMPLPIFSAISLILAAIVAGTQVGGWRWTPLLATGWGVFLTLGSVDYIVYDLSHPENTHQFAWMLGMLSVMIVVIVASIGAAVQNYRYGIGERHSPRLLPTTLAALAAFVVGAVCVAAIPRAESGASVSPEILATLPPITLDAFNGGTIRVKAGQVAAFRLENPQAAGHSFDVDELNVHTLMPGGSNSLALFKADKPGTYTFYCAPHYDKVSGQGMRGTLVVEP